MICLPLDCDLDCSCALRDRVVQALEADDFILSLDWTGGLVLHLEPLSLHGQEVSVATDLVGSSGGESLEEGLRLQYFKKFLDAATLEIFFLLLQLQYILVQILYLLYLLFINCLCFVSLGRCKNSSIASDACQRP